MNVEKIKKILKRSGIVLMLIIIIALTAVIIIGSRGDSGAGDSARNELRVQRDQIAELEGQITSLSRSYAESIERSRELEQLEQRFIETSKRLQDIQREYETNNRRTEEDITELDRIEQQDRETVSRIRELLQEEDPEDSTD